MQWTDIKEKILYIILGTLIPILINGFIGKNQEIDEIKTKIGLEHADLNSKIELISMQNKNRDIKLEEAYYKIQKLEESRANLSDYYVPRIEFNNVIENQQKIIDKIDKNVEKIVEKVMYKR